MTLPASILSQTSELRLAEGSHSAWLDLRPAAASSTPQTVPSWIEALEFTTSVTTLPSDFDNRKLETDGRGATVGFPMGQASSRPSSATALPGGAPSSRERGLADAGSTGSGSFAIFRIRLHRPESTPGDLQVRLLFDDDPSGARPSVSAWDELGNARWRGAGPLGEGLGLATSQSVTVPMAGVDYLEITMPGDGRGLRGAFLSWLETRKVQRAIDSPPQRAQALRDPFGTMVPLAQRDADEHRFGVVTAVLQREPVRLGGVAPIQSGGRPLARSVEINFELERPPLVALLNFEVLNATGGAAPKISINGRDLGRAEFSLPDLADPGFRGQAREGAGELAWQYTSWVRAQKLIPASALGPGMNKLLLTLSEESDPAAVRSVEIQLKYYWEKFDYILAPRQP